MMAKAGDAESCVNGMACNAIEWRDVTNRHSAEGMYARDGSCGPVCGAEAGEVARVAFYAIEGTLVLSIPSVEGMSGRESSVAESMSPVLRGSCNRLKGFSQWKSLQFVTGLLSLENPFLQGTWHMPSGFVTVCS